jgi:coenzyme F420-0:L-glutamate ligase/coenzyme F420-1:gamma-L-glutamate ligase
LKGGYSVFPIIGIPEINPGDDLFKLLLTAIEAGPGLEPFDIIVITSKIVSKAEGQIFAGNTRDAAIEEETVRVLAQRGSTKIVQTHHGLIMAAAGVDASNAPAGTVLKLPVDCDASARRLRKAFSGYVSPIGIIITDTMGRAWRLGLTDNAIGIAGVVTLLDYRGKKDAQGRTLEMTITAICDEIASAAELVKGKLDGIPVVVFRGLKTFVIDEDGPGAQSIIRPSDEDMFGLGTQAAQEKGYKKGFEDGQRSQSNH